MKRRLLITLCLFAALAGISIHGSFASESAHGQAEAGPKGAATHALDARVRPPDQANTVLPDGDANINQLLRLWGVFGERIDVDCSNLRLGALRCLSGRGTLDTLEQFNRPAILLLRSSGRIQRVLISRLGKKEVTIAGANGVRRVSRQRLIDLWTGRYELIWRTNTGSVLIYPGMRSKAVAWLRGRLALASGENSDEQQKSVSRYFGSALEARVRNFQLMHGLKPDGLVGPRTQIVLNGIKPAAGVPTLMPKAGE